MLAAHQTKDLEKKLKNYLASAGFAAAPAGIATTYLDEGKSSNHLNYKVETKEAVFVARITLPNNSLGYTNLADEHTILKLVEKYQVGPRALRIDLEGFETPILLEEYIDGTAFHNLPHTDDAMLDAAVNLFVEISQIKITQGEYPFKYSYTTYETNFRMWQSRITEIAHVLGNESQLVKELTALSERAREKLLLVDTRLHSTPPEFIYNDVHAGNMFLCADKAARFIDWQKVSLGDPSFMLALFANRFGEIWNLEKEEFTKKALDVYTRKKETAEGFAELLHARMFERTVSDAIWAVWASIKKEEQPEPLQENKHFLEATDLLAK